MRSTEHVRLMLNQAWWMRLAIINMSHRKRVWTLESFFAPKESQGESEKNDTEEDQCVNQEETDEGRSKLKKSRDHTWQRYEKEAMFCYFCWKSKRTNPFTSAEGCTNFCPSKNKNVPQNFSQGDKLSPRDQILQLKPWTYVHPLPQGPLTKDLYRQHKNTKSSAFPSTIYHIVRPLVREGHSHEGATKF